MPFLCRCSYGALKTCYGEGDLECFEGFLPLEVNGWENDKYISLREAAQLMNPKITSTVIHVIANLDAVQNAAIASAIILSVYQNVTVARAAQTSLLNLNKIVKII